MQEENVFGLVFLKDLNMADDEAKIRELWSDPQFAGSFSGLLTFQKHLKIDKNINISTRKLRHILMSIPNYLQHVTHRINFPKRDYSVHGFLQVMQADLSVMKPINDFKYLLVCIDLYTLFIWAMPITNKRPETIRKELSSIFEKYGKPSELQTDSGGEFLGNKSFFKNEKIYWHSKRGLNKANYAELAILWLKKKIFAYLHSTDQDSNSYDWPKAVPAAVLSLNSTYHRSLGNLRPIDLDSREKAVLIDRKIGFPKESNFDDHKKNEENFRKKATLVENDYCYIVATKNKGKIRSTDKQVLNSLRTFFSFFFCQRCLLSEKIFIDFC